MPPNLQQEYEMEIKAIVPSVVSFSGGQTSGFMLRRLIDAGGKFMTVFENTGREHDATLDFVHDVETRWGVPIVWLEYCRVPSADINPALVPEGRKRANLARKQAAGETDHWFKVVDYATAARRGQSGPFDALLQWANVLPNVRTRMCSVQLKVRTRDRFLRASGISGFESYIGIRADEAHRKLEILANVDKYELPQFPLIDAGVTKADVNGFWDAQPFKLNIPNSMGNCDMCFLKAYWKRVEVARRDPCAAKWWADWESQKARTTATGDGAFFKRGEPYARVINDARQPDFFLDTSAQDVACSCAVGGYRGRDDEEDSDA
jgi:hypothetical protein